MIYILLIIMGLVLGAGVDTRDGWVWGGLIGLLLAHTIRLSTRLSQLEEKVRLESMALGELETPFIPKPSEPTAERSPAPEESPPPSAEPIPAPQFASSVLDADLLEAARASEPPRESVRPQPAATVSAAVDEPEEAPKELPPREPNVIERAFARAIEFFTTGNPMVRVGALVTIVGVSFLLKYMAERISVPVGFRLMGIAAAGLVMVGFGFWIRGRRPSFALPFQGAGLAVLYLTCFASFRLYELLPAPLAFGLLAILAVATIVLAVFEQALVLAAFGVAGGFLAPVLASTGTGSHVELFGFYLVLNLVITALAWFRSWRVLNWIGFVFTFGIASIWGAGFYEPEFFRSTEPFLVAHVALYVAIAVLFAHRQPPRLKGLVDGTIVFGTPLVGFSLQASMLAGQEGPLATSAAILGAVYVALWFFLKGRRREHFGLLSASFLALGIGFLTLAIPLAFDARVTSALWCLEGAGIVWIGTRQESVVRRTVGMLLALVGSWAFLVAETEPPTGALPFINAEYIGVALISGVFLLMAILQRTRVPRWLPPALLAYGFGWWTVGGIREIEEAFEGVARLPIGVAYFALSAALLAAFSRGRSWSAGQYVSAALALVCGAWSLGYPASRAELGMGLWGGLAGAAAMIWIGWQLRPPAFSVPSRWVANGVGFAGLIVWLSVGTDVTRPMPGLQSHHLDLLWISLSVGAAYWLHALLRWPAWRYTALLHLLVPVAFLLESIENGWPLHASYGVIWLVVLANQWHLLRASDTWLQDRAVPAHAVALWALLGTVAWGVYQLIDPSGGAWRQSLPSLAPLVLLVALRALPLRWPVGRYADAYRGIWLLPVALGFIGWLALIAVQQPRLATPLPQLALLNPVDLIVVAVLAVLLLWWLRHGEDQDLVSKGQGLVVITGTAFLSLNAMVLRAVHVHLGVAWQVDELWRSFATQASITSLWTATALATMVFGARREERPVWIAGAWLMGAAVVKLFLVDTDGSGTLARVVAFFAVAAGLFLGGYFVPKPPARSELSARRRSTRVTESAPPRAG